MFHLRLRSAHFLLTVLLGAVLFVSSGCAHSLGYAGEHPGYVKCKGKGSISGTGSGGIMAGVGGGSMNGFSLQADCGDGFEFSQGAPVSAPTAPAK